MLLKRKCIKAQLLNVSSFLNYVLNINMLLRVNLTMIFDIKTMNGLLGEIVNNGSYLELDQEISAPRIAEYQGPR